MFFKDILGHGNNSRFDPRYKGELLQGFKQVSNIIISAFLNDHVSCNMKNDFEERKNGYWEASEEVKVTLQIKDDGSNSNRNKTKQS